jgi:hypothetical protein
VAALGAFEHDVSALPAVRKKSYLGEYVTIQIVLAAQAWNARRSARHGLFSRLGKAGSGRFFVAHEELSWSNFTAGYPTFSPGLYRAIAQVEPACETVSAVI